MKNILICFFFGACFTFTACQSPDGSGGFPPNTSISNPGEKSPDVVKPQPETPIALPKLQAGDPCGGNGNLEERLKDCARAPDSAKEQWRLVSRRNENSSIWFNQNIPILASDPVMADKFNYLQARDLCRNLDFSGFVMRVPTEPEWIAVIGLAPLRYPTERYWSSTMDFEDEWMKIMNDPDEKKITGDPFNATARVRCVGTLNNRSTSIQRTLSASLGEYTHRSQCEADTHAPDPERMRRSDSYMTSYAKRVCGSDQSRSIRENTAFECVCLSGSAYCGRQIVLNYLLECSEQ